MASMAATERKLGTFAARTGTLGKQLTKGLTVPIVAVGTAAVASAMDVGKGYRIMQERTGETVNANVGLGKSFENVFAKVSESSGVVGEVMGLMRTRTDESGKSLETLSQRVIELARVTKSDAEATARSATEAFANWGISAEQMGPKMDFLLGVTQKTGANLVPLLDQLSSFGPVLRGFGFSFDESSVLLAQFDKAGLNTSQVMMGLRKGLGEIAKAGKNPRDEFMKIAGQMKNAATDTEAVAIGFEAFGSRAGPAMADAVRNGRLSIDELVASLHKSGPTVAETAEKNKTLTGRLQELRHAAELALAPIGRELISAFKRLLPAFKTVFTVLAKVVSGFSKLPGPVKTGAIAILGIAAVAGPTLSAVSKLTKTVKGMITAGRTILGVFTKMAGGASKVSEAVAGAGEAAGGAGGALGGLGGAAGMASIQLLGVAGAIAGLALAIYGAVKSYQSWQEALKREREAQAQLRDVQDQQVSSLGRVRDQMEAAGAGSDKWREKLDLYYRMLDNVSSRESILAVQAKQRSQGVSHAVRSYTVALAEHKAGLAEGLRLMNEEIKKRAKLKEELDAGRISQEHYDIAMQQLAKDIPAMIQNIGLAADQYAAKIHKQGMAATTAEDVNSMLKLLGSKVPEVNAAGNTMLQALIDAEVAKRPEIAGQMQATMAEFAAAIQATPAGQLTTGKMGEIAAAQILARPEIAGNMLSIMQAMGIEVSSWDLSGLSREKLTELENAIRASGAPGQWDSIIKDLERRWNSLSLAPKTTSVTVNIREVGATGKGHGGGGSRAYHEGGLVMQFHTGGLAAREVPAVLRLGEYVIQESAVQRYGSRMLSAVNAGTYAGGMTIGEIHNHITGTTPEYDSKKLARLTALEVGKELRRIQRVKH